MFDKAYFDNYCKGKPYKETLDTHLITYFTLCKAYNIVVSPPGGIQEWMKKQLVLDAGCGMGHVVDDLTSNGVRCEGYDISEYAIENALPSVLDKVWEADHSEQLSRFYDKQYSIVFANSFQYGKDESQVKSWLKHSFRICSHSLFFVSVTIEGLHRCINGSDVWKLQLVKNKKWWTNLFYDAGFEGVHWVSEVAAICLKQQKQLIKFKTL